jgi:chromosome segregation ATPase
VTRRTIADARRSLESDLLPSASDHIANLAKRELAAAEAKAKQHADAYVARREGEILQLRDTALRWLTDARDGLEALTAETASARTTASDASRRLRDLQGLKDRAESALAKCAEEAEELEAVEKDPSTWFDALTQRSPHLRLEWSW